MRVTEKTRRETRSKIVEIARARMADGTWSTLTTRALSKQAGIAAGTLFNYFPSKEAIGLEIVEDALEASRRDLRSPASGLAVPGPAVPGPAVPGPAVASSPVSLSAAHDVPATRSSTTGPADSTQGPADSMPVSDVSIPQVGGPVGGGPDGMTPEEALFQLVIAGLRRLEPYRTSVGGLVETALNPMATGLEAADRIREAQLREAFAIFARCGGEEPPAMLMHMFWTLYVGALVFWANDSSPRQVESLAYVDYATRMIAASWRPGSLPKEARHDA